MFHKNRKFDNSSQFHEEVESSSEASASQSEQFISTKVWEIDFEKISEVPEAVVVTKDSSVDDIENRLLQLRLPDIPEDEEEVVNPIDEDIEARLVRLKFFRKTWCRDLSQKTDTQVEAHSVADIQEIVVHSPDISPLGTPLSSYSPRSQFPTSSDPQSPIPTSSDQNLAQSLSSCNCMVNTPNKASVSMQQNTNMVPNTFPDLMNLQGMVLVLVLTILKLLHYPKFRPKLHYVPAPFPSHPFSNLETTNITTTKPHTDISGKSSVLSSIKKTRCVVWCGNVRGLVQGREFSTVSGSLAKHCEKFAEKVETAN